MDMIKRQTIQMTDAAHERLGQIAKQFKLTRAEVLSAIIESVDINAVSDHLAKMRESKVAARQKESETRQQALKLVEALSPEQLADLLKKAGVSA